MTSINPLPTNDTHVASCTLHKLIAICMGIIALCFSLLFLMVDKELKSYNSTMFLPVQCQQYSNNECTGWQLSRHPPNDVHLISRVGVEGWVVENLGWVELLWCGTTGYTPFPWGQWGGKGGARGYQVGESGKIDEEWRKSGVCVCVCAVSDELEECRRESRPGGGHGNERCVCVCVYVCVRAWVRAYVSFQYSCLPGHCGVLWSIAYVWCHYDVMYAHAQLVVWLQENSCTVDCHCQQPKSDPISILHYTGDEDGISYGGIWPTQRVSTRNGDLLGVLERFELFVAANAIPEERKVPLFLTVIGASTYGVLHDLLAPNNPKTKSFAELTGTLKQHYEPKPLTIAERFHFQLNLCAWILTRIIKSSPRFFFYCHYSPLEFLPSVIVNSPSPNSFKSRLK